MGDAAPGAVGASDVPKAVVKNVDMDADMQQEIVEIAADAVVKFALEKDMAAFVKRAVDDQFGPTWHVIVGRSFGSYVTHGTSFATHAESKYFIYFCAYPGCARAANHRPWPPCVSRMACLNEGMCIDPLCQFAPAATDTYMNVARIHRVGMFGTLLRKHTPHLPRTVRSSRHATVFDKSVYRWYSSSALPVSTRSMGMLRALQIRATPTSSASRASGTYVLAPARTGRGSSLEEKRGRSVCIDAGERSAWCDARRMLGDASSCGRGCERRGSIDSPGRALPADVGVDSEVGGGL